MGRETSPTFLSEESAGASNQRPIRWEVISENAYSRPTTPQPGLDFSPQFLCASGSPEYASIPMRHKDFPLPPENDILTHRPYSLSSLHSHHLSPLPTMVSLVSSDSSHPIVYPTYMVRPDSRLSPLAVTVCTCKAIISLALFSRS